MKFQIRDKVKTKNNKIGTVINYSWLEHMDEYIYSVRCNETGEKKQFLERDLKETKYSGF